MVKRYHMSRIGFDGTTHERGSVIAASGRSLKSHDFGDENIPTSRTEVRSPTSTRTEVRSPTSTRTEVRSPTSTSTEAYTSGNFTSTVTGGAGAGATTTVNIYPEGAFGLEVNQSKLLDLLLIGIIGATTLYGVMK
jgi:hypothetical protein